PGQSPPTQALTDFSDMGSQGAPASTPPHCTPILRRDLGNERGVLRWGLRDDGYPWRCSRWRSALSPVARPPARYPETRAGDFSCARAGIDQKIVALSARSLSNPTEWAFRSSLERATFHFQITPDR